MRLRLEDVVHPSLGQDPIKPNLPAELSSAEFRAYRNGAGLIVLHLRTSLLLTTNASFGMAYLHDIKGELRLPGANAIVLDEFSVAEAATIPYDGVRMAVELWVPVRTRMQTIQPCFAALFLQIDFNIHCAPFRAVIRRTATIQRRFRR